MLIIFVDDGKRDHKTTPEGYENVFVFQVPVRAERSTGTLEKLLELLTATASMFISYDLKAVVFLKNSFVSPPKNLHLN